VTIDDTAAIREYYDNLGEQEWSRLTSDSAGRVSFEVHRRFLVRFIHRGDRVLEIGAGPGRFTLELAALGARVIVSDLSSVQLELNRMHLAETPAESAVEDRVLLDVCDVSRYADGEFDAVVAYGGPLSYAFDTAEDALRGLLRIVRPGGLVVGSVMSMLGTWRNSLPGVLGVAERYGEEVNDKVLATGDMRHLVGFDHVCRMFRARQLRKLVDAAGGEIVALSASNWASLGDPSILEPIERDPERWKHFLDNEVAACAEPGALDGGTHILFSCTASRRGDATLAR
jgi:SAM-dependent methyltransferase